MSSIATKRQVSELAMVTRNIENLRAIARARSRVGRMLDLEKISRIYLRELIDMVGCDGCAIVGIHDGETRVWAKRYSNAKFGKMEFGADTPLIQSAVTTQRALIIGDVKDSDIAGYIPAGCLTNSLISTPIIAGGEVKGIIYLDFWKKHAFGDDDIEFTGLLAQELALFFEQPSHHAQGLENRTKDELTGCYNRRRFDRDIVDEVAAAARYEDYLSLLLVNIDGFGRYNDFHGLARSDALLVRIAYILNCNVRAFQRVYRYGEDEYAVLMTETDKDEAVIAATRLQRLIEKESFEGQEQSQTRGTITVSIGVATYPMDVDENTDIVKAATGALRSAKRSGGNTVHIYDRTA